VRVALNTINPKPKSLMYRNTILKYNSNKTDAFYKALYRSLIYDTCTSKVGF
jgi:hypothetical protein